MTQQALYTAAQTRELDRVAIEDIGIPGIRLMARAGRAAFELLLQHWPRPESLQVFCGTGNNGGDGYIVAALARSRGIPVRVHQLGDAAKIRGDAKLARERALADGVEVVPFDTATPLPGGVVVDALLGTGLAGDVRGDYRAAIDYLNAQDLPCLAIDIPSGLCSDSGRVLGCAVTAQCTVTFIGVKRGLLTGAAPGYTGELHFAGLEVPEQVYQRISPGAWRLDLQQELAALAPRPRHAHKGLFGHVLVIGGDSGMAGAALMAAEAAARCGAGLVSAATRPEHVAALVTRRPEVMAHGVTGAAELEPLLARANALAIGPGLGRSPWSEQLLFHALQRQLPTVLDADALNMLAQGRVVESTRRDDWILTPHPGEAARLLECDSREIQADRFQAVAEIQRRYGGVVLLKGAGTLVAAGGDSYLCSYGNPGMASGGMGDVLSGVLAALLAQGMQPLAAARLGACLHGRAAELASGNGMRGLLATDLMPHLRRLLGD